MVVKIGLYYDPRKKHPWVVRWFGEFNPDTGKKKRYSKSFRLKRDAEAFRFERTAAFKKGVQRDKPDEIMLKTFCKDWFRTRKPELRPGTLKLYKDTIYRLIYYFGGDTVLCKVTPHLAAKFVAELKPLNTKNGQQLSTWTRHKILRNCKTIFQSAVTWELIGKNPFENVGAPKLITTRWHYLKPDEYRKLLAVAPSLRWKAFYALAYTSGLRFGELFALTWSDIDFETGEVRVENRPSTSALPPFYVKDYEARRVPLPKHTLDILTELQAHVPERVPYVLLDEQQYGTVVAKWQRCQRQRRAWQNQDMVNNVLRDFKRHLKWAGIKPDGSLSIHTLRKCCCQNWANHLPINVVKELMGHSSISTTQKFYSQVDEDHRMKAAAVINALVSGSKSESEKTKRSDAEVTPEPRFEQIRAESQI